MSTESTPVAEQVNTTGSPKKTLERSAAYPDLSVSEAVKFTADVAKHFPSTTQVINRDDIAAVLNKVAASIQRDVASCAHYKFFNRVEGGYQISESYRTIANPLSEREKRTCLLQAFGEPKLNAELIAKFDGHVVPQELRTHLIRFHKIAEKASDHAAAVFIKSAKECGVLNDKSILNYKSELAKLKDNNIQFAEVTTEKPDSDAPLGDNQEIIDIIIPEAKPKELPAPQIPPIAGEEKLKIPLTGRRYAYLIYPSDLNVQDAEILAKQMEVLKLLVAQ